MSRSYWLPVIAAIGLALASGVCAKPISADSHLNGNASQGQKQLDAKSQGMALPSPPVTAADIERLARALKAANSQPQSAAEQQQSRDNLKAQQDMAAAARRMFWVGLSEALITFFGVVLVGFTLYHTKRAADAAKGAVEEAKRSAKAAEDTFELTREVTKAELRAYLFPAEAEVVLSASDPTPKVTFRIKLRNTGKTPAAVTYCKFSAHLVSEITKKENQDRRPSVLSESMQWGGQNVGPGADLICAIESYVGLRHFIGEGPLGRSPGFHDETRLSFTVEWFYLDYLRREWGEHAEFQTENIEWSGTGERCVIMRQTVGLPLNPSDKPKLGIQQVNI